MPGKASASNRLSQRSAAVLLCVFLGVAIAVFRIHLNNAMRKQGCAAVPSLLRPSSTAAEVADAQQAVAVEWQACLRVRDDSDVPMTWNEFLQQTPARLQLKHIRLTTLKSPVGVTLIVAYDLARLHMLNGLCASWGGHISAAVYQGHSGNSSAEAVHGAVEQISDAWKRAEVSKACAMDIALYSETTAAGDVWMQWLFPVNSLRSRALLLARTQLVLVLDGDMLVHSSLHASLAADAHRYRALLQRARRRTYHVLPALETPQTGRAYTVAHGSKVVCLDHIADGSATRFNPKHDYPQGCTDFERWKRAKAPYPIQYCRRYEPWGIVDRRQMPWFDVRFRGYGRNKIVFTAALNASGFGFEVDASSFVIHRPHEASSGSLAFSSDPQLQGHIVRMYSEQAKKGEFEPVLDASILHCRAELPWWQ